MGASILVVDDESTTQDTLGVFLETEGYRVATVRSGAEALTRIKEQEFDVIVTDVVMPGVSGLEVLEKTRTLNPGAAVILMTGHATVETAVEALRKGACDYLQKPFRLPDLALCVRRLLRRESGHRDTRRPAGLASPGAALLVGSSDGHAPRARADRALRRRPQQRADHRREWHGQGAGRPGHPRDEPPSGTTARARELRRHPRFAARESALRSREGRLHERGPRRTRVCSSRLTAARSSSTRSPSFRCLSKRSCCASSRRSRCGPSGRPGRSRSTCASSPAPIVTSSARSTPGGSGPTSFIGSTSCTSRCRRCASAGRTSRSSWTTASARLNLKLRPRLPGHRARGPRRPGAPLLEGQRAGARARPGAGHDPGRRRPHRPLPRRRRPGGRQPDRLAPRTSATAVRLFARNHILDVLARVQFNKRDAARMLGISLASLYRKLNVEPPEGTVDEEE